MVVDQVRDDGVGGGVVGVQLLRRREDCGHSILNIRMCRVPQYAIRRARINSYSLVPNSDHTSPSLI